MQDWYALYTKPKGEQQVERALAAKGIETYFPYMLAPRRRGRSSVRPFFPCYLFAHADLDLVGVSSIKWTPGMRYLVGFSGVPAKVDHRVIDAIRRRLDANNSLDERGELLEYGDRVKIAEGPFQDVEAIFERRLSSAGRVRVLVQLLKHWTTMELEANSLRKLSPAPRTARGQGAPQAA